MQWVTLMTAPDQMTAEMWCGLVRDAGLVCRLAPGDTSSFLGISTRPVTLQTLEAHEARAREVLEVVTGGSEESGGRA